MQRLSYIAHLLGHAEEGRDGARLVARKPVKLHQLLRVQGAATEPIDVAGPGDIIAVAKTEDLHTGTCLGDFTLPPLTFPTPMVGLAVTPKTRGDEGKLSGACTRSSKKMERCGSTGKRKPKSW